MRAKAFIKISCGKRVIMKRRILFLIAIVAIVTCTTDTFNFANSHFNNSSIQNFGNTEMKSDNKKDNHAQLNSGADPLETNKPLTITGNAFQHSSYNNILGNWFNYAHGQATGGKINDEKQETLPAASTRHSTPQSSTSPSPPGW